MYAVIKTGGKQYRVQAGDRVMIEKLDGAVGDTVEFDQVLLLSDGQTVSVGTPVVDGAKVKGEIIEQGRGKKLIVYKFKRRKDYRRKNGHRQSFTSVRIDEVVTAHCDDQTDEPAVDRTDEPAVDRIDEPAADVEQADRPTS